MANNVDPDQMQHCAAWILESVASDLGLHIKSGLFVPVLRDIMENIHSDFSQRKNILIDL